MMAIKTIHSLLCNIFLQLDNMKKHSALLNIANIYPLTKAYVCTYNAQHAIMQEVRRSDKL